MARIYREMPLNSIWEGAGNIMALDLLRALRRAARAARWPRRWPPSWRRRAARTPAFDRFADALPARIDGATDETEARRLAQDVALAVQAALLRQHAPDFVFDAFCRSRLGGDWGQAFGTLPARHRLRRDHRARDAHLNRTSRHAPVHPAPLRQLAVLREGAPDPRLQGPWPGSSVHIPSVLPKPDVVALTGGYRRTPFLQLGADI